MITRHTHNYTTPPRLAGSTLACLAFMPSPGSGPPHLPRKTRSTPPCHGKGKERKGGGKKDLIMLDIMRRLDIADATTPTYPSAELRILFTRARVRLVI